MTGKTLQHYKIIDKLGEGGMGAVYKARDTRLLRHVAIKLLRPELMADKNKRLHFIKEAQTASSLNHPNICTIHDINEDNNQHFIVMELVEGQTLREILDQRGTMPESEVVDIVIKICEALSVVHAKGISHRDIKPENIMLTRNGLLKVMDFGLAKLATEYVESAVAMAGAESWREDYVDSVVVTNLSGLLGTVHYMSPEQACGEPMDHRTDIWSFGVLLYEMLTGELPFKGEYEQAVVYSILKTELLLDNIADTAYRAIVQKCLGKDAENRYQNVTELLEDIKQLKFEEPSASAVIRESETANPTRKKATRSTLLFSALAVSLIAILLIVTLSKRKPAAKFPPMRTVRLTSYPGMEYDPSLSPDGRTVAFSWNGQGQDNFDIYVKKINGGNPVRLTTNTLTESMPAWSRDGNDIAFIREVKPQPDVPSREIYIMPALGGSEQKIVNFHPGWGTVWPSLSWSYDNKFIYYPQWSAKDNGLVICKVSLETYEVEQVTTLPKGIWGDQSPRVSPDGKYVAFIRGEQPAEGDIFVKNMEDDEVQRITHLNTLIDGFTWGKDAHSILFASNLDGTSALWKAGFADDELKKVTSGININNPYLSIQGNRLVYTETIGSSNIWKIDLRNPDSETVMISSSNFNFAPDISPDGKKILFTSDRTGTYNIWICDANGENQSQLTFFESKTTELEAKWSPSGSEILVRLEDGLFIMNASGGTAVKVSDSAFFVIWAKDGSGYYGKQYSQNNIYSFTRNGKVQQQITNEGGLFPYLFEDYLYYIKSWTNRDIWRVPVNGGTEKPVLQGVSNLDMASWTIVKNGIYFIHHNNETRVLEFYNFSTNKTSHIKDVPRAKYFSKIEIDHDEKYLLYSQKESDKSDIILVENFTL